MRRAEPIGLLVRGARCLGHALPLLAAALLLAVPWLAGAQGPAGESRVAEQWALERVGAACAWGYTPGRQDVTVAVIDSGADMGHPGLVRRLRRDGFDFVDNDGDPSDQNGHGTHVAGVIAATLGDGATSGLAPGVQILPVRVMSAEGTGGDRRIAAGIDYAVERGARVINLSLGSTLLLATPESSPLVGRAIARALAADVVVVVAAGNDFVPLPNAIVGANEAVIVVAATTRDDRKAFFSNSGPWVDVSAPGERILSTMPTYEVYLTSAALPPEERFQPGYDYMSGTSQAAPFVSALAALLISQDPAISAAEVARRIAASAADIYDAHPSYYRRLRLLGAGRIDACAALGGPAPAASPLETAADRFAQLSPLGQAVGAASALLLVASLAVWASLLIPRRRPARRPQPSPGPRPPPVGPPPGRLGDTIPAPLPAWGYLRAAGPAAAPGGFTLAAPELLIGRAADADISLPGDPTISRHHARLRRVLGQTTIEDLGSSHGTRVNGRRIARPTPLRPGDRITVGKTTLRLEEP